MIKEYTNGEITILWEPKKCIHSAVCVGGLPEVFDPKEKPWIKTEGASSDKIVAQVGQCPSGALSIKKKENDGATVLSSEAIVAGTKPMLVSVEDGKTYAWCACGRSSNQPWCDGSHSVTSIKPVVFKVDGYQKGSFCMCKKSSTKPFCDDSHLYL